LALTIVAWLLGIGAFVVSLVAFALLGMAVGRGVGIRGLGVGFLANAIVVAGLFALRRGRPSPLLGAVAVGAAASLAVYGLCLAITTGR